MSNPHEVNVHLKSTADAQAIDQFATVLRSLLTQLDQAKASMATATPESAAYQATATSVGELAGQVSQLLGEVGKLVTAEEASAKAAATTATARRDEAQATAEAVKAQEALNRSKQADMRNQAVADARRQMAEDLRKAEADTARLAVAAKSLNEEHKKTPAVAGAAAESTRNAGLAALMFSQALEDSQYGLAGVINNIPGLVLAMGGSAGLAGAISVAAVALRSLIGLLQGLDFTGTWIGDVKDGLKEIVTGASEAEAEMQKMAASPVSWSKTGVEAANAYREAVERALTREIELLRERNVLMQQASDLRLSAIDHEERLWRIRNPSMDASTKGTPEWGQRENDRLTSEARSREVERVKALDAARSGEKTAAEEAARLQKAAEAARVLSEGVRQREALTRNAANFDVQAAGLERERKDVLGSRRDIYSDSPEIMEYDRRIEEARKKARESRERANTLPGLEEGQTTTGLTKDAEDKAMRADEAAQRAREAANARRVAAEEYRRDKELDDATVSEQRKRINETVFAKVNEPPKTLEGKLPDVQPSPNPNSPEARQGEGNAAATELVRNIDEILAAASSDQWKAKLAELRSLLTDADGITGQDLEAVRDVFEGVKTKSARGQEMMIDLGRSLADTQTALANDLQSVVAEVRQIKAGLER